jgi:hypothetical protein
LKKLGEEEFLPSLVPAVMAMLYLAKIRVRASKQLLRGGFQSNTAILDSPQLQAPLELAERVGFEPTEPCGSTVFKTVAFDHSATSPKRSKSITEEVQLNPEIQVKTNANNVRKV